MQMGYHKIPRDNVFLKTAMWEVYNKRCVYCGRAILPKNAEIDHIVPESLEKIKNSDDDIQLYIKELKMNEFELNSVENYMLCCSNCNKRKSNFLFTASSMRYFHELALRYVERIWTNYEKKMKIVRADSSNTIPSINCEPQRYNEEELLIECGIIDTGFQMKFYYGLGEVRVDAFLPVKYDDSLCCIVYFKSLYQKDIDITFNEGDVVNVLFEGCELRKSAYERGWCIAMGLPSDEEYYLLDLPNVRIKASAETVEQFAQIFDRLFDEYILQKENIKNILGAINFPECNKEKGSYKILSLKMNIFDMLYSFIQNHSYDDENKLYNIFHIILSGENVALRRNINSDEDAEIYAYLKFEYNYADYVDVIWQPGIYGTGSESNKMKDFDDCKKWTVQYVHDWIVGELFKVIFNERNKEKVSFFEYIFGRRHDIKFTVLDAIEYGWIKSYSKEGLNSVEA